MFISEGDQEGVYKEMIFEQRPELNEGVKPHKDLGRTFQAVEISSAKALG